MTNTATADKQNGRTTNNSQNGRGATPVPSALGLRLREGDGQPAPTQQPAVPPKDGAPAPPTGSSGEGARAQTAPQAPAAPVAGIVRPPAAPDQNRAGAGNAPITNPPFVSQEELSRIHSEARSSEGAKPDTEPKVIEGFRASILSVGEYPVPPFSLLSATVANGDWG